MVDHRLPLPADASIVFTPYDQWCSTAVNTWTGDDSKGATLDRFNLPSRLQYAAVGGVTSMLSGPDGRQQATGQFWVTQGGSSSSIRNQTRYLPAEKATKGYED